GFSAIVTSGWLEKPPTVSTTGMLPPDGASAGVTAVIRRNPDTWPGTPDAVTPVHSLSPTFRPTGSKGVDVASPANSPSTPGVSVCPPPTATRVTIVPAVAGLSGVLTVPSSLNAMACVLPVATVRRAGAASATGSVTTSDSTPFDTICNC